MDFQGIGIQRTAPGLVVLHALLFTLFLNPQGIFAEDSATLELNPPRALRGQDVIIRVRTTIPWAASVQINRPELQGALLWWSYPYARPWSVRNSDGTFSRMIEVVAAVRVNGIGFHSVAPFRIDSGSRGVVTDISRIIGLENDEQNMPYPLILNWRSLPQNIWQGQSVPVILEARNLPSLVLAESAVLNQVPAGLLVEAAGYGRINTRPYGQEILYDVPMASWVWTLGESGRFDFPGARVRVNGLNRSIKPFTVNVLPLPSELSDSGAIGRFTITVLWDDEVYRVGDVLSIRVRISGSGNLSVLKTPEPELKGLKPQSSTTTSSYIPGSLGFEGWREDRYDFRIENAGNLDINVPEWYWFDPADSGRLYREASHSYQVTALESRIQPRFSSADRLLGPDMFRYRSTVFQSGNLWCYILLLPGILCFISLLIVRRTRILAALIILPLILLSAGNFDVDDLDAASVAVGFARKGDWSAADKIYRDLEKTYTELPGLLSDRAVIAMEKGEMELSVWLIRRALHLRPGNRHFTETLNYIENRLGFSDQAAVPLPWPPMLIFLIWLIAFNVMLFAISRLLIHREARDVILMVSMVIVFMLSSAAQIYTENRWDRITAVVTEDAKALRKIPGPLGTDWIKLPPGTAVSITVSEGNDSLVLTGYGLQGWLPFDSLRLIDGESHGF